MPLELRFGTRSRGAPDVAASDRCDKIRARGLAQLAIMFMYGWRGCCVAALAALTALTSTVRGQQRPALPPALAPFVSIDAPVVALTHVRVVDGTEIGRAHV